MTTVGIRDLKNSLSRYLRLVREGETVVILDRGHPVATLSPVSGVTVPRNMEEHLANLAARGLVTLPSGKKRSRPRRRPRVDLSGAVIEDREDRA
jgi:prevent-host-death family protein